MKLKEKKITFGQRNIQEKEGMWNMRSGSFRRLIYSGVKYVYWEIPLERYKKSSTYP